MSNDEVGYPSAAEVRVAFAGLALGMFLPAANATMVATALPAVLRDLGGFEQLSLVVTSYLLASAVALPLAGKLSDLYGRRPLYIIGLALFVVGSLWAAMAGSVLALVAARSLQGFGGGGVMTVAQTAVADLVPPRRRGVYLGAIVAVLGLASVVGPLLGGLLVDRWSWRAAFHVNVPLGLLAIAIAYRFLPRGVRREGVRLDVAGAALLITVISAFVVVVAFAADPSQWGSPFFAASLAVVVGGAVALVLVERRTSEPVLPPELFSHRAFSVTLLVGFLVSGGMFAVLVFVPVYLQGVLGMSASEAGTMLLALFGTWVGTTTVVGRLVSRWDRYRAFPVIGTALLTLGFVLLARMGDDIARGRAAVYLAIMGVGFGMTLQILVVVVQNTVPIRHLGAATSAVQLVRTVGGTVGVSVAAAVVNIRLADRLRAAGDIDAGRVLGDLEALDAMSVATQGLFRAGLADGITFAFLLVVPLAAVAWAASLLLPETPAA